MEVMRCPECGVPEQVTSGNTWLASGAMVQTANPSRRLGFIECESLKPVSDGIGDLIGMPIDRLVINITQSGTVSYIQNVTSPEIRKMAKSGELPLDVIVEALLLTATVNGFGKYEFVEVRFEGDDDDFLIMRVADPFSILLSAGILAGSCEAITERANEVTFLEISPNYYEVRAFITEHPEELMERLKLKVYEDRQGDVELERCQQCGGPKALSSFAWECGRGTIVNSWSGRRMAMIGPEVQDPVFTELERELGGAIPEAVVEAQRRFVKSWSYSGEEFSNEDDVRVQLAIRGLGNLRELKRNSNGMFMRIDNAADHLMTVGTAQGIFELRTGRDSNVEWEMSDEDNLTIQMTPCSN